MMKTTNTNQRQSPTFRDVSRYTRWINNMDRQDKALNPVRRKAKWLLFLGAAFFTFVLSFVLFPSGGLKHQKLDPPEINAKEQPVILPIASPFELPTDSFENLLTRQIHENVFAKK